MPSPKANWKRAPMSQRRMSPERSAPKARFTRSQRSGSLPPSLTRGNRQRFAKPLLILAGVLLVVGLSVALVIAVGAYIRAEQNYDEIAWRSTYYGLPTQPFATPAPTVMQTTAPLDGFAVTQSADTPATAALDDPRWVAGTAIPLRVSFALRTEPVLTAAVLEAFGDPTPVMFISEVEWGVWAQVKINDTIGWVDATSVRLEAGP
jgi:hypothetical protein